MNDRTTLDQQYDARTDSVEGFMREHANVVVAAALALGGPMPMSAGRHRVLGDTSPM